MVLSPIYSGKDESLQVRNRGHTHAIVVRLLEGLEGRGHHVYTNNYHSSPALFAGIPATMKTPMNKGDVSATAVDENMMALKWMDKRPVSMLSTIHDNTMTTKVRRTRNAEGGREEIWKPVVVEQYNCFTGVDKSDQLLSYYRFSHKLSSGGGGQCFICWTWAYVLYTLSEQSHKKLTHELFCIRLAREMLLQVSMNVDDTTPVSRGRIQRPLPPQTRLTERHFPDNLPQTPSRKKGQTECTVCSKKKGRGRKTTTYMCKQCKLPMCIIPCFQLYHTKVNPQRYF